MPTYQYVCTDCDTPLEIVQSFSDDTLTDCPACATGRLRKVYGSVGVVFKGSGFYRNDSRSTSTSTSPASTSSGSDSSSSSSDSSGSSSSGSSEGGSSTPASTPATTTPSAPSTAAAS
ncbi:MAG: FmdB family transcriptional regulator [Actinobacteria bacterium]|nr:FmdB family transcriptional regulator [Actinomycetota bacterium]